jgi:hypothetical protein
MPIAIGAARKDDFVIIFEIAGPQCDLARLWRRV